MPIAGYIPSPLRHTDTNAPVSPRNKEGDVMRGVFRVIVPALLLALCIVLSFGVYAGLYRRRGAAPEALLASLIPAGTRTLCFDGTQSNPDCRLLFELVRQTAEVVFVQEVAQSRYDPLANRVYITTRMAEDMTAEAVHEYGHAVDRYLGSLDGDCAYYSQSPTFTRAYQNDQSLVCRDLDIGDVFSTSAFRNPAISDILFTLFASRPTAQDALLASYRCAGVTFWRHDREYLADTGNRLTEIFADIFLILVSDDEAAKSFLYAYLPQCTGAVLCAVEQAVQNIE